MKFINIKIKFYFNIHHFSRIERQTYTTYIITLCLVDVLIIVSVKYLKIYNSIILKKWIY